MKKQEQVGLNSVSVHEQCGHHPYSLAVMWLDMTIPSNSPQCKLLLAHSTCSTDQQQFETLTKTFFRKAKC